MPVFDHRSASIGLGVAYFVDDQLSEAVEALAHFNMGHLLEKLKVIADYLAAATKKKPGKEYKTPCRTGS